MVLARSAAPTSILSTVICNVFCSDHNMVFFLARWACFCWSMVWEGACVNLKITHTPDHCLTNNHSRQCVALMWWQSLLHNIVFQPQPNYSKHKGFVKLYHQIWYNGGKQTSSTVTVTVILPSLYHQIWFNKIRAQSLPVYQKCFSPGRVQSFWSFSRKAFAFAIIAW
jgi:hypothetical protein